MDKKELSKIQTIKLILFYSILMEADLFLDALLIIKNNLDKLQKIYLILQYLQLIIDYQVNFNSLMH